MKKRIGMLLLCLLLPAAAMAVQEGAIEPAEPIALDEIVLTGSIDPDLVDTPGVCVDMIVKGTGSCCREGNGLH